MNDAIRKLIQQYIDEMRSYQDIYGATDMETAECFANEALAELAALETHKQIIMDMLSDMRSVDVYNSDWEILRRIKAAGIEHKALDVLGEGE